MLHPDFLTRPLAHRGLHRPGIPENSMAAFRVAVAGGFGIELDIQPAADGTPLVFHDYDLNRLTGDRGVISALSVAEAGRRRLLGTTEGIPTLSAVLGLVAGRVPVLIEIKDQDGGMGPGMGGLPAAVGGVVRAHLMTHPGAPVAVMSFNPHAIAQLCQATPGIAVGLTSCAFPAENWPGVPADRRAELARLSAFDAVGAGFVSHHHHDLANPAVGALAARGIPVLCWTIRSRAEEAAARRHATNIIFEGYDPCAP